MALGLSLILHYYFVHLGFVSNGEYNVFRAKGYSRPLSILQLRSMARNKYSTMGVKKMMAMLTPKGMNMHMGGCHAKPI